MNLEVKLGSLRLQNPVLVASGTFGTTDEYSPYVDYEMLGGIITKSITLNPREGNPSPRIWEVKCGMLNAIGLENKGLDDFVENVIPYFEKFKNVRLIVSIAGNDVGEYKKIASLLNCEERVDALEVNISCPNVKKGGAAFLRDIGETKRLIRGVRDSFTKALFVKLSPEAVDFPAFVELVEREGCDGVSMINTIKGLAVDISNCRPRLGNIFGGLSGPAIKPIALRYVYETRITSAIPIIGGGGIINWRDAVEFLIVGADAVSVGTANFLYPDASLKILNGIKKYISYKGLSSVEDIPSLS